MVDILEQAKAIRDLDGLKFCTPKEIEQTFNIQRQTLANWRSQKDKKDKKYGPPYRRLGGRILYELGEVLAWIDANAPKINPEQNAAK